MSQVLTKKTQVQCAHGGIAIVGEPKNHLVKIDGDPILVETDVHAVAGCGNDPKLGTCAFIVWSDASKLLKIQGAGVLLKTSKGKCLISGLELGIAIAGGAANLSGNGSAKITDVAGLAPIQSLVQSI